MMNLRTYKEDDAKEILSWIKNEREFRLWSADRYEKYPALPSDINNNYLRGKETSNFYPFTLEDEGKIIGHLILRNPVDNKDIIRLGFIIVDSSIRGKGYGKLLIKEAVKYAKEKLDAKEINLGVFTNNEGALQCYKSAGFKIINIEKKAYQFYEEQWDCAEMVLVSN